MKIFTTGPIRPPFHANSLLLRITENCTWNKCNFCTLYRGGKFKTRSVEEIKEEIDNVVYYRDIILKHVLSDGGMNMDLINKEYRNLPSDWERECFASVFNWMNVDGMKSVFLQDANTLVLKPEILCEIGEHIKKVLPSVKLIAAYGRGDALMRISLEDLIKIKNSGINMIHSGYESGSDTVLKILNKGCTQADEIDAGKKVKEAGIEFNIFYMHGSGGKKYSEENAIETAKVISAINPDYVRLRSFVVKNGTPMHSMVQSGEFIECSDIEKNKELRLMMANIKNCDGYIISDHIINLLSKIEGHMDKDLPRLIKYMDDFLNLPEKEIRKFQLARRMYFLDEYKNMSYLNGSKMDRILKLEKQLVTPEEWENYLNSLLRNYI